MHAMRIPATALSSSQENQGMLEAKIAAVPEVAYVFSKTGTAELAADPMAPSVTDNFLILADEETWRPADELLAEAERFEALLPADAHAGEGGHGEEGEESGGNFTPQKNALMRLLRAVVATVPGNNYEFTQPIEMRFNELISGVRSDLAIKVFGDDFDVMLPAANAIAAVVSQVPGSSDVKVEQTEGLPVLDVSIDRQAISRLGLTLKEVQDLVAAAVGGKEAGLIFQGDRRFDLIVRLPERLRADVQALRDLPVPLPARGSGDAGMMSNADFRVAPAMFVPLGDIADLTVTEGLNQVSRENGKRRVVVQANVRGRDIGGFVDEVRTRIAESAPPPPGTYLDYGGQFENLERARERLLIVVPVCFLLIFGLLYATFGNAKDAVMVFVCVPLALTGGILALWLRGMPFSISAAVGFIALSGVAVLNGLVMVTFINERVQEGDKLEDAIIGGSLVRLRPVLMTALVAALGFVPMAIATGAGAEVQKPLATVVIGGIVSATALTLIVLPAVYRLWHRKDKHLPDAARAVGSPSPTA